MPACLSGSSKYFPSAGSLGASKASRSHIPRRGSGPGLHCSGKVSSWAGCPPDLAWPGPAGQVRGQEPAPLFLTFSGMGPADAAGAWGFIIINPLHFWLFLNPQRRGPAQRRECSPSQTSVWTARSGRQPTHPPRSAVDSDRRALSGGPGFFPTVVVLPGRDSRGRWLS